MHLGFRLVGMSLEAQRAVPSMTEGELARSSGMDFRVRTFCATLHRPRRIVALPLRP